MSWFKDWFGTEYYKMLYRHRNDEEARLFLDNLITHLKLDKGAKVLDLACGRGRHSIYLASKGLDVTGIDLAADSIEEASLSANNHLHFIIHDMREKFPEGPYAVIINAFTSFGYFETEEEDLKTLKNVSQALNNNGYFVFDYFNVKKVINEMQSDSEMNCDQVQFKIHKFIENKFIVKNISVTDHGKTFLYTEKVKLFTLEELEEYFNLSGLKITACYGNYNLDPFEELTSDRLIILATKSVNI